MVSAATAEKMLDNFEQLLHLTKFYVLICNMEQEAAEIAYQCVMRNA
jgi:hypothetical protein